VTRASRNSVMFERYTTEVRGTWQAIATCAVLACSVPSTVFVAPHDGADAPAIVMPTIVAVTAAGNTSALNPYDVMIPAVRAGDLVLVGLTIHSNASVISVVDGTSYMASGAHAALGNTSSDIWYLANAAPNFGTIRITTSAATAYEVWVVEIAHAGALDHAAGSCVIDPPRVATAQLATTVADEVVFGVTMLSTYNVTSVAAPFLPLMIQNGNAAAYYIAPTVGSFGPAWGSTATMMQNTCSSTAAFLPG
jgi:hypothetical protein